jgi:hypothetical protein
VHDRSALLRIESVEESVYREGGHVHRVGGPADKRGDAGAPARDRYAIPTRGSSGAGERRAKEDA